MTNLFDQVLANYQLDSNNCNILPIGNGLINQTYLLVTDNKKFVLQKINTSVFPKPEIIARNLEIICQTLTRKKENGEYLLSTPQPIKNQLGKYLTNINDEYWRLISFIENAETIEQLSTTEQAFNTAMAFAQFSNALVDTEFQELQPVIQNFHNIESRMQQLEQAIVSDLIQRKQYCNKLIESTAQQSVFVQQIAVLEEKLPIRVTHNDTKINNLLFDKTTKQAKAVIDLDTCMPGYLMHDFGDMVRTCCSNLAEDDTRLTQMEFRQDMFQALISGYLTPLYNSVTEAEIESLVLGAKLLPFMIGIRFLTDYLNGDTYFSCKYSNHNLDRAKNQFRLFELINQHEHNLKLIVKQEFEKLTKQPPSS